MRASDRLREMLAEMRLKVGDMVRSQLPAEQLEAIATLAAEALERRRDAPALSPLETNDREDEIADWLEDHGVAEAWDYASTLVAAGVNIEWLQSPARAIPNVHARPSYPLRALASDGLL